MKINFSFDGHDVEMEYTYHKGRPAPRAINERTFLTPPESGELEIQSVKVDGQEKEVNIDEGYLLEQMALDEENAIENVLMDICKGEC